MSIIKLKNNTSNGLKMVSLFAGCGGSSMGYRAAGYDVRLAVEWDKRAADLYRKNLQGTSVYEGDISGLTPEMIVELSGVNIGELDVLDGSPPCQGFSLVGSRDFHDDRNQLFNEYVRVLRAFMPRAFIMENVAGVAKGKMKIMFSEMTRSLKAVGYRVSCRKLNAWWYGVPQSRERLIWVGIRGDIGIDPSHPKPILKRPISVQQALGLSMIDTGNIVPFNSSSSLAGTPPRTLMIDANRYKGDQDFKTTAGTKPRLSTFSIQQNTGFKKGGRNDPRSERKLSVPSPSLTSLKPYIRKHKSESTPTSDGQTTRYLTIEESKIIQSFPDWFEMKESDYKYIGNSVPPLMAKAVGSHVAELLSKESGKL
jgi:DNA (cytosine-5)-methyltransferase 1